MFSHKRQQEQKEKVWISSKNGDVNDTLNENVLAHIDNLYKFDTHVDLDEKSAGYVALATIKSVYDQLLSLKEEVRKMKTEKSTSINDYQKAPSIKK